MAFDLYDGDSKASMWSAQRADKLLRLEGYKVNVCKVKLKCKPSELF